MARIDVEIVREAIDNSGVDYPTLADRLGWYWNNKYNTPDATRVRRRLGIVKVQNGSSKRTGNEPHMQRYILTSTALAMLEVVGLGPTDIGL